MKSRESEEGWWGFLKLCANQRNAKEFDELFQLFLTAEEHASLGLRYLIVSGLVAEDKTQRELAQDLKVSIAKITRGSNSLKLTGNRIRKQMLNK